MMPHVLSLASLAIENVLDIAVELDLVAAMLFAHELGRIEYEVVRYRQTLVSLSIVTPRLKLLKTHIVRAFHEYFFRQDVQVTVIAFETSGTLLRCRSLPILVFLWLQ